MVRKNPRVPWAVILVCVLPAAPALAQTPLGTAFTYQGRLTDAGAPANGAYDLQFTLYDAVTAGNPVGSQVTVTSVSVSNGLFTVTLDFGASAFAGSKRWLEVGARPGGSTGSFVILTPRQELEPARVPAHLLEPLIPEPDFSVTDLTFSASIHSPPLLSPQYVLGNMPALTGRP